MMAGSQNLVSQVQSLLGCEEVAKQAHRNVHFDNRGEHDEIVSSPHHSQLSPQPCNNVKKSVDAHASSCTSAKDEPIHTQRAEPKRARSPIISPRTQQHPSEETLTASTAPLLQQGQQWIPWDSTPLSKLVTESRERGVNQVKLSPEQQVFFRQQQVLHQQHLQQQLHFQQHQRFLQNQFHQQQQRQIQQQQQNQHFLQQQHLGQQQNLGQQQMWPQLQMWQQTQYPMWANPEPQNTSTSVLAY